MQTIDLKLSRFKRLQMEMWTCKIIKITKKWMFLSLVLMKILTFQINFIMLKPTDKKSENLSALVL